MCFKSPPQHRLSKRKHFNATVSSIYNAFFHTEARRNCNNLVCNLLHLLHYYIAGIAWWVLGKVGGNRTWFCKKRKKNVFCNADGWTVLSQGQTVPKKMEFCRISPFLKFRNRVTGNLKPLRAGSHRAVVFLFTSHAGWPWEVQEP